MKNLLIVAIFALPIVAFTQSIQVNNNFQLSKSDPFDSFGSSTFSEGPSTFYRDNELLSFRTSGTKFSFMKYENSTFLNEVQRIQIEHERDFLKEAVIEVNGHYYFFYSAKHAFNKKSSLLVREIDFDSGAFKGDEKLLFDSPEVMEPVQSWGAVYTKFEFAKSFDGSKLMAIHQTKAGNKKKVNKTVGLHVYDDAMNQLWYHEVELPYESREVIVLDAAVDGQGRAYLLVLMTKHAYKNGDAGAVYKVLNVNSQDGTVTSTDVEMGGIGINSAELFENYNGEIVFSGLYAVGVTPGLTDGVYIVKMNSAGEVLLNETHEVPNEVIALNSNEQTRLKIQRSDENDNWGLKDLNLKEVIPGKDGSTTVIAERFSVGSDFHVDMKGNVRDKSNVYYGSILVARIENDGTLSWLKNLPKSQTKNIYGASRSLIKDFVLGEMGFTVLNKHSDPIFVFLDNVNNLELPDTEVPDNHRDGLGGFLTGYRINRSSGEVQKMSFLDLRDFQGMVLKSFARDRVYQLSENEFAVEFNTTEEGPAKKSVMVKVLLNK